MTRFPRKVEPERLDSLPGSGPAGNQSPRDLQRLKPIGGLDPHGRLALWETLRELHPQGRTIVLTTHHMEEADRGVESLRSRARRR